MSVTDNIEKKFVIKHVFNDVKNLIIDRGHGAEMSSPVEEHFGVEWKIRIYNNNNNFIRFFLDCFHTEPSSDWSIDTEFTVSVRKDEKQRQKFPDVGICSAYAWMGVVEYTNSYLNGNKPVEIHVIIKKMTGIKKVIAIEKKKKLKNFDDDAAKEFSDVVLKIGDQKFYVNKMYLASHSSYFKSLFSGNFSESGKAELELKEIDPNDFQDFLELMHGDSVVKDDTVAGILKLADFFDSKTAFYRCEEFLLNRSEQSLKFKFHAAIKYKLDKLKEKCFSEMNKNTNFEDLAPENPSDFGLEDWKELYQKAISFI